MHYYNRKTVIFTPEGGVIQAPLYRHIDDNNNYRFYIKHPKKEFPIYVEPTYTYNGNVYTEVEYMPDRTWMVIGETHGKRA